MKKTNLKNVFKYMIFGDPAKQEIKKIRRDAYVEEKKKQALFEGKEKARIETERRLKIMKGEIKPKGFFTALTEEAGKVIATQQENKNNKQVKQKSIDQSLKESDDFIRSLYDGGMK